MTWWFAQKSHATLSSFHFSQGSVLLAKRWTGSVFIVPSMLTQRPRRRQDQESRRPMASTFVIVQLLGVMLLDSWCPSSRSERAVRCGRKKCVEFILWRMGADTEIADYGGFTPVLNTGKPFSKIFVSDVGIYATAFSQRWRSCALTRECFLFTLAKAILLY